MHGLFSERERETQLSFSDLLESRAIFIVRSDARPAHVCFQINTRPTCEVELFFLWRRSCNFFLVFGVETKCFLKSF